MVGMFGIIFYVFGKFMAILLGSIWCIRREGGTLMEGKGGIQFDIVFG